MPLSRYRVPKIARRGAFDHMNDCDLEIQSRGYVRSGRRRARRRARPRAEVYQDGHEYCESCEQRSNVEAVYVDGYTALRLQPLRDPAPTK